MCIDVCSLNLFVFKQISSILKYASKRRLILMIKIEVFCCVCARLYCRKGTLWIFFKVKGAVLGDRVEILEM